MLLVVTPLFSSLSLIFKDQERKERKSKTQERETAEGYKHITRITTWGRGTK